MEIQNGTTKYERTSTVFAAATNGLCTPTSWRMGAKETDFHDIYTCTTCKIETTTHAQPHSKSSGLHTCTLYWFKLYGVYLLYSDHGDDLSHYPTSTFLQDGNIHDIWNGDAAKPLIQKGCFLDYPEHLALSLSTDGVPVFKSSGATLWPVYLTIENLPPRIRFKNENTITCGLWFGPKKPAMNLLLLPVVKNAPITIHRRYTHGCTFRNQNDTGQTIKRCL